ncbi:60 kDa lysophospholipase-like [Chanos chanos]|uniref:asparaginase n=1 Tax=Chanos chanos TaxID=29144 RepID=A0A6J2UT31_CHACN|nr:60 kDa lysophospholipase-like [Chanos chanos]
MTTEAFRKVFVLYTGGTIGMRYDAEGQLAPTSLKELKEFLIRMTILYEKKADETEAQARARIVSKEGWILLPQKVVDDCRPEDEKTKCHVHYKIEAMEPLIDSSNMVPEEWFEIARRIQAVEEQYDSFVVLHGTDTMAYTSSALSFILKDLKKPVILTGAQRSIFHPRSDAVENFIGTMLIAGCYSKTAALQKVTLCNDCKVFQGNRVCKFDCDSFRVFDSPNVKPLAYLDTIIKVRNPKSRSVGETISVKSQETARDGGLPDVRLLRFFPGIQEKYVRSVLEGADGVVLETFGSGNVPEHDWLKEALIEAKCRKVMMLNCTQVYKGTVQPIYETSEAGVVVGYDITPEAAMTKMIWTLKTFSNCEMRRKHQQEPLKHQGEALELEVLADWSNSSLPASEVIADINLNPPLDCSTGLAGAAGETVSGADTGPQEAAGAESRDWGTDKGTRKAA